MVKKTSLASAELQPARLNSLMHIGFSRDSFSYEILDDKRIIYNVSFHRVPYTYQVPHDNRTVLICQVLPVSILLFMFFMTSGVSSTIFCIGLSGC